MTGKQVAVSCGTEFFLFVSEKKRKFVWRDNEGKKNVELLEAFEDVGNGRVRCKLCHQA